MIVRPNNDVDKIDKENQARYRTSVGMLLYLVKYNIQDLIQEIRSGNSQSEWM